MATNSLLGSVSVVPIIKHSTLVPLSLNLEKFPTAHISKIERVHIESTPLKKKFV